MVLVTGSTGFVGRHIARELRASGMKVRCLARSSSDVAALSGLNVEVCYGDVTNQVSLEKVLENVETTVHLAAIIRETRQATFEGVNFLGTRNLTFAAKKAGVRRFVYMSNLGTSPDPRFPLLYSKWRGEEQVRNSGIGFTIFRPSVMFGRGDGFVTVLANVIKRLPIAPVIGSGRTRFQPISVEDVATCVVKSLQNTRAVNQVIPLGGPEHLAYEDIVDLIIQTLKLRRLKVHIPIPLMRFIVLALEKFLSRPPVTSAQLAMLAVDNITSLDIVERVFGFNPVSLRQKISDMLA
jgi:uncharacterized protein YbjT (DUF2867 family)